VTDSDENTLQVNFFGTVVLYTLDAHTGYATVVTQYFIKYAV
jgi:hypothetical protein